VGAEAQVSAGVEGDADTAAQSAEASARAVVDGGRRQRPRPNRQRDMQEQKTAATLPASYENAST